MTCRDPAIASDAQVELKQRPGGRSGAELGARYATLAQWTIAILIATLLVLVYATFNRYGFNTDEARGYRRALQVFAFFSSGGTTRELSGIDIFHGAAPDIIALALQKLIPSLSYDSRHLVSALFGVAGIYYVYRFGATFVAEMVGLFAALFLAITPVWFGHMFLNHKDIPFATLLLASTYYALILLTDRPTSGLLWAKTALATGLLVSTKAVGIGAVILLVAVFFLCFRYVPSNGGHKTPEHVGKRVLQIFLAWLVGSMVCFIFFWPQVFTNVHEIFSAAKMADKQVFHGGHSVGLFLRTTPIYLLILGTIGAFCAVYRREGAIIAAIIIFSVAFAASEAVELKGGRHLLFVYPFFMMTAAYPVSLLFDVLKGDLARAAIVGALAVCSAGVIAEMYRLFPYQYSFYNVLSGGFAHAGPYAPRDQWRSAEREALDQLASRVTSGTPLRIYSCGSALNSMVHGFVKTDRQEDADYIVVLHHGCLTFDRFEGLPIVGEVRREGVLLARIHTAHE